jgi:hypothetical protein
MHGVGGYLGQLAPVLTCGEVGYSDGSKNRHCQEALSGNGSSQRRDCASQVKMHAGSDEVEMKFSLSPIQRGDERLSKSGSLKLVGSSLPTNSPSQAIAAHHSL